MSLVNGVGRGRRRERGARGVRTKRARVSVRVLRRSRSAGRVLAHSPTDADSTPVTYDGGGVRVPYPALPYRPDADRIRSCSWSLVSFSCRPSAHTFPSTSTARVPAYSHPTHCPAAQPRPSIFLPLPLTLTILPFRPQLLNSTTFPPSSFTNNTRNLSPTHRQ